MPVGVDGALVLSMLRNKTQQQPVGVAPRPVSWDQWGTAILAEEETIGWAAIAARLGGARAPKTDQPQPLFARIVRTRAVPAGEDTHDDVDDRPLFLRLPPELLLAIVEASPDPLRTYISLMRLSHAIRTTIRGAPHELSFEEPDHDLAECSEGASPVLTADALAALVGPCKGLIKLTLPARTLPNATPPLVGCGLDDAACLPWVREAFAGHSQLAVLHVPWAEPLCWAIQHILPLLPGLEELHFLEALNDTIQEVLAQSCPRLRALHFSSHPEMTSEPRFDFNALRPLWRTLRELDIETPDAVALESLMLLYPNLEHLTLRSCKDRCIAHRSPPLEVAGSCGLRSLSLLHNGRTVYPIAVAAQLLARLPTLQTVELVVDESPRPLLAPLLRLSHLTSLRLCFEGVPPASALDGFWPLVDRLDRLSLEGWRIASPVSITSSRLRNLSISTSAPLTLACPALEVLALPAFGDHPLVLDCPRLRSIAVGVSTVDMRISAAMPNLTRICGPENLAVEDTSDDEEFPETAWLPQLLDAASPSSLRHLSGVCITEPATLDRLWALNSLTRLEARLDVDTLTDLHLPGHIQFLVVFVILHECEPFRQVSLEAQGLRTLALANSSSWAPPVLLALRCPALVSLNLKIRSLAVVGLEAGSSPPLCRLTIAAGPDLSNGSLLDALLRHGHQLQHVALVDCSGINTQRAWSSLKCALEELPRLASLELTVPDQDLELGCSDLRRLVVVGRLSSLALNCPLLEELRTTVERGLKEVELDETANLRLVEGVHFNVWLVRCWVGFRVGTARNAR
ncbi:hypothetical protein PAPYR_10134 [Paratrimastix pyriformis]|uniref:F-box domain-containing protein n=1 Tax=Paratrimastix pyriformis TaxID=342808 RepID=A0ABQ8U6M4_9EUKA|nr:hypothetical protein PAPYR_10134 [Paratrimastix pyriformis]